MQHYLNRVWQRSSSGRPHVYLVGKRVLSSSASIMHDAIMQCHRAVVHHITLSWRYHGTASSIHRGHRTKLNY